MVNLHELLKTEAGIFALQLFEKVEVDKPAASRSESAEIYVIGLKYKAPAKIDPRLLDVKHLFQDSVEPQTKVICFRDLEIFCLVTSVFLLYSVYFSSILFISHFI